MNPPIRIPLVTASYSRTLYKLGIARLIQVNWGFTPESDQQVGGLLMWVPMCLVYLSAITAQFARYVGSWN